MCSTLGHNHPRIVEAVKKACDGAIHLFSGMLSPATVASHGTLVVGGGVASSTRLAAGQYRLAFNRNVESCTCVASLGAHGNATSFDKQNSITANCRFGSPEAVQV